MQHILFQCAIGVICNACPLYHCSAVQYTRSCNFRAVVFSFISDIMPHQNNIVNTNFFSLATRCKAVFYVRICALTLQRNFMNGTTPPKIFDWFGKTRIRYETGSLDLKTFPTKITRQDQDLNCLPVKGNYRKTSYKLEIHLNQRNIQL